MKYLTEKEINRFVKKSLPIWKGEISCVSLIKYGFVKEYLINEHYLLRISPFKIIEKDLQ